MEHPDRRLDVNQTAITIQSEVRSVRILAPPALKNLHALPGDCKDDRGGEANFAF